MDDQPPVQSVSGASFQAADSMTFTQSPVQKDGIMSLYGVQQQQQQYPGFVGYQRQAVSGPSVRAAGMAGQHPSMYQQHLQYQHQLQAQQQMHVSLARNRPC